MLRALFPCFAFSFLAATANAQVQWSLLNPPTQPAARSGASLVFDPSTQRAFLHWGVTTSLTWAEAAWMWDGATWTQCTVTASTILLFPSDAGVVDDGTGGVVMFGGRRVWPGMFGGTPQVIDQTWRATATAAGAVHWTLLSPPTRPAARQGMSMVRTNQGVLLFGGCGLNGVPTFGDTWLWNGTTWAQLSPPTSPGPRSNAMLTFDAARNVAVLFGGYGGVPALADTWEFDGAVWTPKTPVLVPPARGRAMFVWSPVAGRSFLFGGAATTSGSELGDAWTWDGTQWSLQPFGSGPGPRQGVAATCDPIAQRVLTFGGRFALSSDTYLADVPPASASYTAFGAGCPGPTAQIPTLAAAPNELPAFGTTSHLIVSNLPAPALTLPVFVLGTSNTWEASPGYPLPFDLGFLGWSGCAQLVSHDVMIAVPTLTGQADYAVFVPPTFSLLGFTFHAQALVLYVPTGVAVSNALTGVVGS